MTNDQIRTLVVPRIFEKIGKDIINRRNSLGESFNLKKNKPEADKMINTLTENFNTLSTNNKFKVDQFITSIESSSVFKELKQSIERSIESSVITNIEECIKKTGALIIKNFKTQ